MGGNPRAKTGRSAVAVGGVHIGGHGVLPIALPCFSIQGGSFAAAFELESNPRGSRQNLFHFFLKPESPNPIKGLGGLWGGKGGCERDFWGKASCVEGKGLL